ncbi:MAG: tetratricopeptide repeat protein, partial [Thermodesulfobacteriota bacterium]
MALKDKILERAQKYVLKGYLDKAIAEYRSAADVDPRDISIRLRIGDLYVKTNRTEDAIKEYIEVAKANVQRGFYPKAIAVYKKVLKFDDSNLDIHYKLADLYTRQRLIADAISSYSFIVSTFERLGKTSEVMELLKKMLDIDPDNIGIRLKLADLFQKLSFDKDALAEYAMILDKLMEHGKLDRAEKIFLSLYASKSKEPVVLNGLAQIYKRKGDEEKFLDYARTLLKVHRESGEAEGAKAICDSILEVRPDDPDALGFIGGPERPVEGAPVPVQEEPSGEGVDEAPLISWPEEEIKDEDIEITFEGFDEAGPDGVSPKATFKDEEVFEVVEPVPAPVEEPPVEVGAEEPVEVQETPEAEGPAPVEAAEEDEEVEIEFDLGEDALKPALETAPVEEPVSEEPPVEEEAPVEAAAEEAEEVAEEPVVEEEPPVE